MKKQVVLTAPAKKFKETYLTKKGERLKSEGATKEELKKYTKNRYVPNPDSKPFTTLIIGDGKPKLKQRIIVHLN